jgi:hypothetical protein
MICRSDRAGVGDDNDRGDESDDEELEEDEWQDWDEHLDYMEEEEIEEGALGRDVAKEDGDFSKSDSGSEFGQDDNEGYDRDKN